jgi:hypothetical protein
MKTLKLFAAAICVATMAGGGQRQAVSASPRSGGTSFRVESSGTKAAQDSLFLTQDKRRGPELRPQTGPVCRYEPVDVTKPAPGQCGFNDLGLPVHGTFRCSTVPRGNDCVQRCEFVSCVNSNR